MSFKSYINSNKDKGFTLLELLIVSIIIAILIITMIAIMQRVTMRSRDAARLTDMANLYQAIQATIQNNADSEKLFYILCSQVKTPCQGSSFPLNPTTRKIDGTGWLKITFNNKDVLKYNFLPLDPLNNEQYNYSYFSDGKIWKLETKLESDNFKKRMSEDGGNDPEKYELIQKLN